MIHNAIFERGCYYGDGSIMIIKSDDNQMMICCSNIEETTVVVLDEDDALELANTIIESYK